MEPTDRVGDPDLEPMAPPQFAPPVEPETRFPGNEILVYFDNNVMALELSNKGGVIKKALMKNFHDNGDPIDLVQHMAGAKPPLTIISTSDKLNEILQNGFYEVSTETLTLDETTPTGKIVMHLQHEGVDVLREFTFHYETYLIEIETRIAAPEYADQNLNYMVLWGPSLGGEVSSHTDHFVFTGATTFLNNERVETPADSFADRIDHRGDLEWTAFQNKYFAAAMIPGPGIESAVTLKETVDGKENLYVGLNYQSVQSAVSASHFLYVGTKELSLLEKTGHKLMRLLDYGWLGNKFAFLVKPLLKVLHYFYSVTQNYGWSIIFLTICIKIIFFPLTHKSFKSMKGMQKIQPYVKVIQERNKKDRQKMNEELMELYKKHRVNPLGGCLPMLLQIPVFIALYHALFFSIELHGAPFFGWIQDLSAADPYYVTPVLMGATMFLQQKMTPSIGDPMQQKIMLFLPIVFTFLFMTFPAGLVIYWTVNNLLTVAQQYYIYKVMKD